jgi:hypothetical protein
MGVYWDPKKNESTHGILARIGDEFSPTPAVKTITSTPCILAA